MFETQIKSNKKFLIDTLKTLDKLTSNFTGKNNQFHIV